MERFRIRALIRTGLVRVLLLLTGFLVRVTDLINPGKNSGQTADDDESMNDIPDSWPEAWTQRIKNAKHVSWFSFKAQRNAPFPRQRTLKPEKDPIAENRCRQDTDVSIDGHESRSGAGPASAESIPPISRVFDPRTRLWIYESSGERITTISELFLATAGGHLRGQPESEKAGITAQNHAPFPFQNMEPERPLPESGDSSVESHAPASFDPPGKFGETRSANETQANGNLPMMDRFKPSSIQTKPRSETLFPESTRDDSISSIRSDQNHPTENTPSYPRWTEIGSFDDPAARSDKTEFSSFSSHADMSVKQQGPSTEGSKEDTIPSLHRPWPELEELNFSGDLKKNEHRGDHHDRLLRLKLEQKGSLWSVSRF